MRLLEKALNVKETACRGGFSDAARWGTIRELVSAFENALGEPLVCMPENTDAALVSFADSVIQHCERV